MMDSYNYKTYYSGTPKDIEESNSLTLLRSSDFNISLESLEYISEVIENSNSPIKIATKEEDQCFLLKLEGDIFEFDVILYHNPKSGYVGYTIFSSLQRCYSTSEIPFERIKIYLSFNRIEGENNGTFIKIQNFIDPNVKNKEILGSEERWEYQESKYIFRDSSEENYLKFTNRIPDYLEDKKLNIITDSGVITHRYGVSGFNILSGVDVGVNEDNLENFTLGIVLYEGDISLLKYNNNTGEYSVSSLSKLNQFGLPLNYISGELNNSGGDLNLLDYNGQAFLFSSGDNYIVCPLKTSETLKYQKSGNHVVLNRLDPLGEVRYISGIKIKEEILRSCSVPPLFIPKNENIVYQSKLGDWWEFKTTGGYLYISVYGYIQSWIKIDFINSRIGLYKDSKEGVYHFLPIKFGHNYLIRKDYRSLDNVSKDYCDIIIKSSDQLSSLSPEIRCFLDGLRRRPIRMFECFPRKNIIGVGLGMIFYLSDGLLYCY